MKPDKKSLTNKEITEPQIFQVNAFVAEGCKGNPAGVCLFPAEKDESYCRKIAVKMALPETAFVFKRGDIYQLRWFTRGGIEVALCGHATLATAWTIWHKGFRDKSEPIYFNTKSGILTATLEGEFVTLDFPADKITEITDNEHDFGALLGVTPLFTGKTKFDYLIVVGSEKDIRNLNPDFERIKKLPARGIIVTAKAGSKKYDFVSRFFAPAVGIDEDPVTGSAHCALGVYWAPVLKKDVLMGYQASREGGMVRVTVLKDRVLLGGKAREVKISGDFYATLPL